MATDPELLRSTLEDQLALLREQLLGSRAHRPRAGREPGARGGEGGHYESSRSAPGPGHELERKLSRNSGNSSKPPSSDTLTGKAMMAARRRSPKRGKAKRRKGGKQRGLRVPTSSRWRRPTDVVVHAPMSARASTGFSRISVSA